MQPWSVLFQLNQTIPIDEILYQDDFDSNYRERWKTTDTTDWGSVTKDTLSVMRSTMVYQDEIGIHLKAGRLQKAEKGFYYDGTESEPRYFGGSEIQSIRTFNPKNRTGALLEMKHCIGPWYSLWLMEHNSPLPGERYREIDILERFSYNKARMTSLTITVHHGTNTNRFQCGFTYYLPFFFKPDYFDEDMFFIECQEKKGIIRTWVNGILCFKYNSKTDWTDMHMRSGAVLSSYNKKLDPEKIIDNGRLTLLKVWERK